MLSSTSSIEDVGPPARAVRRPPPDLVTLVAASVLLAVPFVVLHHVNTVDGPADVLGGRILGSLGGAPIVRHYYVTSFGIDPNVLAQLMLAALMVAVSPTWAEKILVAGYVVALPLAVRYAIRSVNPSAGWATLVWLPFVVSFMLLYGFYDFCYAMVGVPIAIGVAIRSRGKWSAPRVGTLALVLVATYFAHVVPLVMAIVVIATITAVDAVGEWYDTAKARRNPSTRSLAARSASAAHGRSSRVRARGRLRRIRRRRRARAASRQARLPDQWSRDADAVNGQLHARRDRRIPDHRRAVARTRGPRCTPRPVGTTVEAHHRSRRRVRGLCRDLLRCAGRARDGWLPERSAQSLPAVAPAVGVRVHLDVAARLACRRHHRVDRGCRGRRREASRRRGSTTTS